MASQSWPRPLPKWANNQSVAAVLRGLADALEIGGVDDFMPPAGQFGARLENINLVIENEIKEEWPPPDLSWVTYQLTGWSSIRLVIEARAASGVVSLMLHPFREAAPGAAPAAGDGNDGR